MLLLQLAACGKVELEFSPAELDFGEVDFAGEMPDDGYATETVTLTNVGNSATTLSLPEYDTDRLCLTGYTTQEFPVDLGTVDPGSAFTFVVGLCSYISGEIDTEVRTELDVYTDGNPGTVTLPITFTPIRSAE